MCRFIELNVNKPVQKKLKNKNDMNKLINKIFTILTLAFALSMTACLTDSEYDNNQIGINPSNNKNYVEVHLTSGDNTNAVSRAFASVNRDTTVTELIPINLTSGAAKSAVTVSFQLLDTTNSVNIDTLVNSYGYAIPDLSKITILNTGNKVTIPAGSSTGYVSIKFNPSTLVGINTIFGIKITAVSDSKYMLSNLTTGYVKILIKNQWDGLYEDKGYFIHPTLGTTTFDDAGAAAVAFATIGANTVEKQNAGDRAIPTDVTITDQTMVVNGATVNKVTVFIPSYAGNSGQTDIDPSTGNAMNYYNPATKTFELFYWYNSAAHRIIRETLIYQGSR